MKKCRSQLQLVPKWNGHQVFNVDIEGAYVVSIIIQLWERRGKFTYNLRIKCSKHSWKTCEVLKKIKRILKYLQRFFFPCLLNSPIGSNCCPRTESENPSTCRRIMLSVCAACGTATPRDAENAKIRKVPELRFISCLPLKLFPYPQIFWNAMF